MWSDLFIAAVLIVCLLARSLYAAHQALYATTVPAGWTGAA